jgi:multidrug efflux system membrane fusion protein
MLRQTCRVLAFAAIPLFLLSCAAPGGADKPPAGAPAAGRGGGRGAGGVVPVVTARVEQKAVPVTLPTVGTVEAIASVQIRSQVTGQLSAVHFAEGQDVAKGQPLFSLDARPFAAALQQAEAVLARDTATLQNAQAQQLRAENLFQRGLLPRDQYDTQRAGAAALTGTVAADKAAIESAKLNLQNAEIASPITGRTGALGAHVGDLVRANDTTPLVVINQFTPVYVTFSVPGRYLADIRRYQSQRPLTVTAAAPVDTNSATASAASVTSPAGATGAAPAATGVVSFIDNFVDASTGTIRLKATFPNGDRLLWPGAFVQVSLQLTTDPDALVVPVTALQVSQDGQFVYVVKPDRTAEMRAVKAGRQQGDQIVIAEGLSAGEVVVTDGQLRLTPGARVSERGEPGSDKATGAGRGRSQAPDSAGQRGGR